MRMARRWGRHHGRADDRQPGEHRAWRHWRRAMRSSCVAFEGASRWRSASASPACRQPSARARLGAAARRVCAGGVQVVLSNTGDAGYQGFDTDSAAQLAASAAAPRGFPAKLLVLLHGRWQRARGAAHLLPCELISRNGDTLRGLVSKLAQQRHCRLSSRPGCSRTRCGPTRWWTASVPEALAPAGAVAEPHALWAIERQPRLVLPCKHPAIVVTDELQEFESLKLWLLNLGTLCWPSCGCAPANPWHDRCWTRCATWPGTACCKAFGKTKCCLRGPGQGLLRATTWWSCAAVLLNPLWRTAWLTLFRTTSSSSAASRP